MSHTLKDDLKRIRRESDNEDREYKEQLRSQKKAEKQKSKYRRTWKGMEAEIEVVDD